MSQKEALKVIVIGAGSTGLLLAQGLKQVRLSPNLSPHSMANEPVR
jgi:cation diffusion facilitator CzcD-associated flavoprotein CzcO